MLINRDLTDDIRNNSPYPRTLKTAYYDFLHTLRTEGERQLLNYAAINGYEKLIKKIPLSRIDIDKIKNIIEDVVNKRYVNLSIVKYLVENGGGMNVINRDAIVLATINGHLSIIRYLVEQGLDLNVYGNRILENAYQYGNFSIVRYLIDQGVDISKNINYILEFAAKYGNLPLIEYLIENGANIRAHDNAAIRRAAKADNFAVVEYLFEKWKESLSKY